MDIDSNPAGEKRSEFIGKMLIYYFKKPLFERERILFKSTYDKLIMCCENPEFINFTYSPIFNSNFSHSFSNLNSLVSKTNSRANSAIASSRRSSSSGGGGGFSSGSSGGGGSHGGGGGF